MNSNLCCLYPAYGAMVHALPNDAQHLNGLAEELIIQTVIPFFKAAPVKPVTERQFNGWINQLNGLDGLDDLDGLKKKLKKVAKKVVQAHKKVAKALTSKKLARPFAYAIGAATGTIGLVAKAEQMPVFEQPTFEQPSFNQGFMPNSAPSFMPQSQPQYTPSMSVQQPINYTQPVQRLEQPDDQEQGRIVGLNTQGIMDSIKANPLPWAVGAGVLVLLVTRR